MRIFLTIITIFLFLSGGQAVVYAAMSGSAELGYGDFVAEESGVRVEDASYFSQRYTASYKTGGQFLGGRMGGWQVGVGAEWSLLDSDVNGSKVDIDTAKILYNGRISLAPGGLPFRLEAFSFDNHATSFSESGGIDAQLLDSDIRTDVNNGTHRITGFTLLAGIRNGSYLGRYRNMLSHMPRLLIDFKESEVDNDKAIEKTHYLDRELAFVSLNKKDNWLHYRLSEHRDFINPINDQINRTALLGTVDHQLQRKWINLTNWVQVSADGSYSQIQEERRGPEPEKHFDLNLFAIGRRPSWEMTNFSTFNRIMDDRSVRKSLEIPLFLKVEPNQDTLWRFRSITYQESTHFFVSQDVAREDDLFASVRVETRRQKRYVVAPHVAGEVKDGDRGRGVSVRAGVEVFSNRQYQPRYDLLGSYSLSHFSGTSINGLDVDYWEHEVIGKVEARLNSKFRTGVEQRLLLGHGVLGPDVSNQISPHGKEGLVLSSQNNQTRSGSTVRSTTTMFADYNIRRRFQTRFEIVYDLLSTDLGQEDQLLLRNDTRLDRRNYFFRMYTELGFGAGQSTAMVTPSEVSGTPAAGMADMTLANAATFHYSKGKALEAQVRSRYDWQSTDEGDFSRFELTQDLTYNFFNVMQRNRKILVLSEEIIYERLRSLDGGLHDSGKVTLGGTYFPVRRLALGGETVFQMFPEQGYDQFSYRLNAGLTYAKLQLLVEYENATRSSGPNVDARDEYQLNMKLKKAF